MKNNVNEISDDFSREPEEYEIELYARNEQRFVRGVCLGIVGFSFGILIAIAFF